MDWRHQAACLDEDPELFFPVGTTGPALEQVERAKAVCHGCAAIDQCLEWALESNQDAGVWGGMSKTSVAPCAAAVSAAAASPANAPPLK